MKLYLDAGHGGKDPGAVGNGLIEKEIVLDLAKRIHRMLTDYPQAIVKLSREKDETKSLTARTNEANEWGADIFLSLHCNAFNGRARGYEDFIYNRLPVHAAARNYQTILHEHVANAIGIPNRGKKQANFHVLRESKMPALLTENGFIDHPEDAKLMRQNSWREKVAAAHVKALVEIFNLKNDAPNKSPRTYTIVAGSFQQQENAEARKLVLEAKHISASVQQTAVNGKRMFRVQAGTFSSRQKAEAHLKKLALIGIEAFIIKGN